MTQSANLTNFDAIDRKIIVATQNGLPLVPRPYDAIATEINVTAKEVKTRFKKMMEQGVIRRIGVVPNHYRLGYTANGMSVWDIDENFVDEMGEIIGALDYVSHCYRRPRHLPLWPYNLFAMVHGKTKGEVQGKVESIAHLLAGCSRQHDILYSTKVLKKTGLRLGDKEKS